VWKSYGKLQKYILGVDKSILSSTIEDPDGIEDAVSIVNFDICPIRQFIADGTGDFELIRFTPVNFGICRNGCGMTHISHGSLNTLGEAHLIDGDLDFSENCSLVRAPVEMRPYGQGNSDTYPYSLCSNGCGCLKKETKGNSHDCTGMVVRGFQLPVSSPPVQVPFAGRDLPNLCASESECKKPWVMMLYAAAELTRNAILQRMAVTASYINKKKLMGRVSMNHQERAAKRAKIMANVKAQSQSQPRSSSMPSGSPARLPTSGRDRDRTPAKSDGSV